MDDQTASGVLGKDPLALMIKGRREEALMVKGYEVGSGMLTLGLRTRINEPQRIAHVHRSKVEAAPPES